MRRGNIIAGSLLIPLFVLTGLLVTSPGPQHQGDDGALLVAWLFSFLAFVTSFFYLILRNATTLENTAAVQSVHRHMKTIRDFVLIWIILISAMLVFSPKKSVSPTKEAHVSSSLKPPQQSAWLWGVGACGWNMDTLVGPKAPLPGHR